MVDSTTYKLNTNHSLSPSSQKKNCNQATPDGVSNVMFKLMDKTKH